MDTETFKAMMTAFREELKMMVAQAVEIKTAVQKQFATPSQNAGEMTENIILSIRHLEDAAMRFGKAIQAADGGVSPLGGPNTPGK